MSKPLLKVELLRLLRDTRAILLSVILPILLMPVLLLTFKYLYSQANTANTKELFTYALKDKSTAVSWLVRQALDGEIFSRSSIDEVDKALEDGSLELVIELSQAKTVGSDSSKALRAAYPEIAPIFNKDESTLPSIVITYRSDEPRSIRALVAAREQLAKYREQLVSGYFTQQQAPPPWQIDSVDLSSEKERESRRYGSALAAFIVIMVLGSGSVAAMDSLAGERERGTLVTLFLSSLSRQEIVITKFCAVAIASLAITLVQALNLAIYILSGLLHLDIGLFFSDNPLLIPLVGAILLAELLFLCSALIAISARCGSFKEAQLFFFPSFLIATALSLFGLIPGITSASIISLVPIAGPSLLVCEILAGSYNFTAILLVIAVHLLLTLALLYLTVAHIGSESFLDNQSIATGFDFQLERLGDRVLPFYALLGAMLMVVPSNFEELSTLSGQVLFNQLFIFVACPLMLLAFFGIKPRQALANQALSLPILICCLGLIPLGQLAATGLSHLLDPFFPAPEKAAQQMMELLDISKTPAWQLYLLIGIIPGICEEFAFRGVLLYALHRRFSPLTLSLLVAIIFGFFHMSFFRILPTAFLGYFLGILVLASGSLVPSIVVHIGNNCLAVWAMLNNWEIDKLDGWVYSTSFIGLIILIGMIKRLGKGYPGTSWSK